MANVKLPKSLDPVKSAQKRAAYEGVYVQKDLTRFQEAVASVDSDAQAKVEFAKDAQGLTYFQGVAGVAVSMVCQRCNQPFSEQISTEFCYSPVQGTTQSDGLPERYEPVEVDEHGHIELFRIIEDELILSLPVVALHAEEDCNINENDMTFGKIDDEETKPNPFAVLKELKRD